MAGKTAPKAKRGLRLWRLWHHVQRHSAGWIVALATLTFLCAFSGTLWNNLKSYAASRGAQENASVDSIVENGAPPATQDTVVPIGWTNCVTDSLYQAVQSLFLSLPSDSRTYNPCIGLARISSIALAILVATQALTRLFRDSFSELRLRVPGRETTLVCGLGRLGTHLALTELGQGRLVVVLEPDSKNPSIETVRAGGGIVFAHDPTNEDALAEHILRRPARIHIVTDDDTDNLNVLANTRSIRSKARTDNSVATAVTRTGSPVPCYIHIANAILQSSVRRCLSETGDHGDPDLDVRVFNIHYETASQLIIDELTPLRPKDDDEVALYVIFGFGPMGQALFQQLIELAHFENGKRSRILVVTPDAEGAYRRAASLWPRFGPRVVHRDLGEVNFDPARDVWSCQTLAPEIFRDSRPDRREIRFAANVEFCPLRSPAVLSKREVNHLVAMATAPGVCPVFFFCDESDSDNFRMSSELEDMLQDQYGFNRQVTREAAPVPSQLSRREFYLPIFAFLPRSDSLRDVLLASRARNQYAVRPFGDVKQALLRVHTAMIDAVAIDIAHAHHCEQIKLTNESLRRQSRPAAGDEKDKAVHAVTAATFREPMTRDEFALKWKTLSYWEQVSNRNAAEHSLIKVQFLNYQLAESQHDKASHRMLFDGISDEEKKRIAQVEHNRWLAERLMMGWEFGDSQQHPHRRRSLSAWEFLEEADWSKVFEQIEAILDFFEKRAVFLVEFDPSHDLRAGPR